MRYARAFSVAFIALLTFAPVATILAQQSLSVSVTPPLFQLTIGRAEEWSSVIKIVNNNNYDVDYYATVVNFEAQGENGKGDFKPIIDGGDYTGTLAGWITVAPSPISVPKNSSGNVPFTVKIPEDAPPGGHYAAVLIGTEPGLNDAQGNALKVSSFVSSLLFVRVKGEAREAGRIREFSSVKNIYTDSVSDFVLRFENTGNTHLRPQGLITIYNMFGKERGRVEVNQKSVFGNVLPESVRKFEFTWNGADDVFDIGRYSAEATLSFGEEGKQSTTARTTFWIVPVVPVATVLGTLFGFGLLMFLLVRRYVRRALALQNQRLGIVQGPTLNALLEPLKEGAVDLRAVGGVGQNNQRVFTFGMFVRKYRMFFIFLGTLALIGFAGSMFFSSVLSGEKKFEIEIKNPTQKQ